MGNLLLVGLLDATGDLEEFVREVASLMGVTGSIVPANCDGVVLLASTDEGPTRGQTEVARSSSIRRISIEPANAAAPISVVEVIERAKVILIGAGSLFTSVLAACAVPGIMRALAGTQARTIYVANLHEQVPETSGYSLPNHVDALHYHGVNPHVVLVDNTVRSPRKPVRHPKWSPISRAKMASSMMCKNWRRRSSHKCDD